MCGILAVIGMPIDKNKVATLSSRMSHRGPDQRDMQTCKVGTICHERLAIMDVANGKQPIKGTRNTWISHNGEVYNYKELYKTLLNGVVPKTTSDSEVILHLYEKFGHDICNYMEGMYTFVILDEDNDTFLVARDPLGIKPLYWGQDSEGRFWFASEMKSICDICVTFDVFPTGHYFSKETGLVKYYQPKWENGMTDIANPKDLKRLLEQSVHQQMMSDVPFGVLLSGGLDSSLISAIAARKVRKEGKSLHSFAIGLSADVPDLVAARDVAAFIGTVHHEVYFSIEEAIAFIPTLIWHLESYDVTTVRASTPMYFLTKYIKEKGFKMVLSGEGADELLGGYLYNYNAPNEVAFQEEIKRSVRDLHTVNLLRADKSTMASSIEVRVPFLDTSFIDYCIRLEPNLKRPMRDDSGTVLQMEKHILRTAFDDLDNPYLPDSVLWRQKEQFSDGVGYNWIDGFKAYCENAVSDADFLMADILFPHNTPETKEAFYIRRIFESYFPQESAIKKVKKWIPRWQKNTDPSGRVAISQRRQRKLQRVIA
jgi:asparagine synthase (glutamine-hydrolysing)